MRQDINLLIFVLLCFASLIDIEILGAKVSQLALVLLFPFIVLLRRRITISIWRSRYFQLTVLYVILLWGTFYSSRDYLTLNFSLAVMICLFYGVSVTTLLGGIAGERLADYIDSFIKFIVVLLVVDIGFVSLMGYSPFQVFATNPVEGYKNHQLMSNEPNWLSSLIILMQMARCYLPRPPSVIKRYGVWLIALLILNSRIVIFLSVLLFIIQSTRLSKKMVIQVGNLIVYGALATCGIIAIFFLSDIDIVLYDLLDLSRNPRLNDFIFLLDATGTKVGVLSGLGAGGLPPYTVQIPWRETANIVMNSLLTQFYFEFGVLGLVFIFLLLLFDKAVDGIYFSISILLLLTFHNSLFKPLFWVGLSLIYLANSHARKIRGFE